MIDDLFDDDPFDLDSPAEVAMAAGSGIFDDHRPCSCWCDCERAIEEPEDLCQPCRDGRHLEP